MSIESDVLDAISGPPLKDAAATSRISRSFFAANARGSTLLNSGGRLTERMKIAIEFEIPGGFTAQMAQIVAADEGYYDLNQYARFVFVRHVTNSLGMMAFYAATESETQRFNDLRDKMARYREMLLSPKLKSIYKPSSQHK